MTQAALSAEPLVAQDQAKAQMNIVIVGHVDHGKSTLVGRLLHDTDALPDGKLEQIKQSCDKRGMPFEWAFLMDALQAERDQNVTIDTSQIWFSSAIRRYCIIDAPGHREFLKNMITGAAAAEAALLLIDANEGIKEQSKRHAYLLYLLGIRQVAVVINKMDLVDYSEETYNQLVADYTAYLKDLGIEPKAFIPISAREGDNIASASSNTPWYKGETILQTLDSFETAAVAENQPLRFGVQDVYRFDRRRIIAGRIESGSLKVGDTLLFSPANESAKVKSIEVWPEDRQQPTEAGVGESVGITLDEQIFVERGMIASHLEDAPQVTSTFAANLFWLHDKPLEIGMRYRLKLGTAEFRCEVKQIIQVLDTGSLSHSESKQVEKHQVAEVLFQVKGLMVFDDPQVLPKTGRFVLFDEYAVAGGGIVTVPEGQHEQRKDVKSENLVSVDYSITTQQRAAINGHRGGVLWFTGLSGSGKSTLAKELQKRLFAKGFQVYVLDGDNVRQGLCSDLGFSADDRGENIRRIGEVAALFADAGIIVITAFISPYAEDRRRARAMTQHYFNTVYIKADVETCEGRDVKGLYAKARAGEIKGFTGIDDPYEEPDAPDLVIDTQNNDIQSCITQLLEYVEENFVREIEENEEQASYAI
ncbi:MAG: adenylyl-sulfate kinase [Rickettsiales bacterium]|nr:adenylyl-sulfate kinase [Rickettsiales bacterium]